MLVSGKPSNDWQAIKRLFKIMLEGCGREYCFCKFCKSNPGKNIHYLFLKIEFVPVSKQDAMARASENFAKGYWICDEVIPPKSLQFQEIQILTKDSSKKSNFVSILSNRICEVFGNYESLNISFLRFPEKRQKITENDPRICFASLRKFFDLIQATETEFTGQRETLYATIRRNLVRFLILK